MNANVLTAFAGSLLSLVCLFYPPARRWFEGLSEDDRGVVMAALLVLVAALSLGGQCIGVQLFPDPFTSPLLQYNPALASCGALDVVQLANHLLTALLSAATGNQVTYLLLKKKAVALAYFKEG